jgi:hypothetical protein
MKRIPCFFLVPERPHREIGMVTTPTVGLTNIRGAIKALISKAATAGADAVIIRDTSNDRAVGGAIVFIDVS